MRIYKTETAQAGAFHPDCMKSFCECMKSPSPHHFIMLPSLRDCIYPVIIIDSARFAIGILPSLLSGYRKLPALQYGYKVSGVGKEWNAASANTAFTKEEFDFGPVKGKTREESHPSAADVPRPVSSYWRDTIYLPLEIGLHV